MVRNRADLGNGAIWAVLRDETLVHVRNFASLGKFASPRKNFFEARGACLRISPHPVAMQAGIAAGFVRVRGETAFEAPQWFETHIAGEAKFASSVVDAGGLRFSRKMSKMSKTPPLGFGHLRFFRRQRNAAGAQWRCRTAYELDRCYASFQGTRPILDVRSLYWIFVQKSIGLNQPL